MYVGRAKQFDNFCLPVTIHRASLQAYEGDHGALMQCMLQGIKETIAVGAITVILSLCFPPLS